MLEELSNEVRNHQHVYSYPEKSVLTIFTWEKSFLSMLVEWNSSPYLRKIKLGFPSQSTPCIPCTSTLLSRLCAMDNHVYISIIYISLPNLLMSYFPLTSLLNILEAIRVISNHSLAFCYMPVSKTHLI